MDILNPQQFARYRKLQAFSLDQIDAQFPFSQKLAKENGWSLHYTQRVMQEYKRFAFLATVVDHVVCPSEQVDQAWHLHLTYTRSYWQDFCPNLLEMPLHHEPTKGGQTEQITFWELYGRTLESYEAVFGEVPPADIWSSPSDRFGKDVQVRRVNTQENWVIPKPNLPKISFNPKALFPVLAGTALIMTGCEANPLEFVGSDFLAFYVATIVVVTFLAAKLRSSLRFPSGKPGQTVQLDPYETAYLAKGPSHLVDAVITNLAHRKQVEIDTTARQVKPMPSATATHPLEQAALQAIATGSSLARVRSLLSTDQVRDRLIELGLLVKPQQAFLARLYPTLMIAGVLGLGAAKILVGLSRGKPIGFLVVLVGITAIIGLCFCAAIANNRSRFGDRTLAQLEKAARQHSKTAIQADPQLMMMAFALFGVTAIAGSGLGDLEKLLNPPVSNSSSSGDSGGCSGGSSGCGGGGGCGGGCGGCGGCGG
jgi:uncharacterized protein (TIGR04222 family)